MPNAGPDGAVDAVGSKRARVAAGADGGNMICFSLEHHHVLNVELTSSAVIYRPSRNSTKLPISSNRATRLAFELQVGVYDALATA